MLKQRNCEHLNKSDFMKLVNSYATCHYRENENGVKVNWLDENLDPDTGEWLSRKILKESGWPENKAGYERGKDYNHSGYCDLIIRGVCGVSIDDGDILSFDPLLPQGMWDYFFLDRLPYKNRIISVVYDRDGSRYNKGKGLSIFINGQLAGQSDILKKINVDI